MNTSSRQKAAVCQLYHVTVPPQCAQGLSDTNEEQRVNMLQGLQRWLHCMMQRIGLSYIENTHWCGYVQQQRYNAEQRFTEYSQYALVRLRFQSHEQRSKG